MNVFFRWQAFGMRTFRVRKGGVPNEIAECIIGVKFLWE